MASRRACLKTGAAALLALIPPAGATGHTEAPAAPGDDWATAPPERHGLPSARLAAVLDEGESVAALRGLVVVREGVLVGERYFAGASASELLPIHSVTKSVSSMLVGIALQQGRLKDLSEPVRRLLPEAVQRFPDSAAADVTLEQILTGRTGLAYDFRSDAGALASAPDPVAFAMGRPADPRGPAAWSYNDAAVSLLSPMLQRGQDLRLEQLAERDLFTPLGIARHAWQRDRTGVAMSWSGLRLRTRDLARLAWTMADGGRWRGRQVVPAEWVAGSTRPQGSTDWRVAPVTEPGYGRLWFTGRLHGHEVAWGWGYGAQFALLAPGLKLAVCTAATAPPPQALQAQNRAVMALVAQVVALAG